MADKGVVQAPGDVCEVGFGAAAQQVGNKERLQRHREKIDIVKVGIEGMKRKSEENHKLRQERYAFVDRCVQSLSEHDGQKVLERFHEHENQLVRQQRKRWKTADFEPVRVLGEGAYGVVHLVRLKDSNEFFALKQMEKEQYQNKNRRAALLAERAVLADAETRWFVDLFVTFQDAESVYLVMEFVPGGDLFEHLQGRASEERIGRFSLREAAFYSAELLEALDTLHKYGYVHRDVKPHNVVLTAEGHLKLLDFGLCKDVVADADDNGRHRYVCGTPEYMAPECFKGLFSAASDLWALGVLTFHLLCGCPPFYVGNSNNEDEYRRLKDIIYNHHETVLHESLQSAIADGLITPEADGFFRRLICKVRRRPRAEELRREAFFAGLDFSVLHTLDPPIKPAVAGPGDASNFPDLGYEELPSPGPRPNAATRLEWADYEFDRRTHQMQKLGAVRELLGAAAGEEH